MKFKVKLLEASGLSEYEKMREFEIGKRRENIKACGDDKLLRYQRICKDNGFTTALAKIEAEIKSRGIGKTSTTAPTATVPSVSTTAASTGTSSFALPPISELLDEYEKLIPQIMDNLRKARTEEQLEGIASTLSAYPNLIILYLLVALLSEYKTAQTVFRNTMKTEYGINLKTYILAALDDPVISERLSELISKYNLIMY